MYTVKTIGGFDSIQIELLSEAIEWGNETNLSFTVVNENDEVVYDSESE